MNLALTFYSVLRMPIRDIIACSIAAEKAGFGYISVAESFYRDGFALASAIATHTKKVKFGTSVMPIYTRTPFQIAMGAATLYEISGGRVAFLGLGVGYRGRTEQYFGIRQTRHLERMTEYIRIIRHLLSGEDTTYRGKFFHLEKFPKLSSEFINIPIYLGSSGSRMLQLAGRLADGVILNSISTPEYVSFAKEKITEGAKLAGRDPSKMKVGHSVIFAAAEDVQEAIDAAKEDILFYISYPELDPVIERSPFTTEVKMMRELLIKGEKKQALSLIDEEMLDAFAVYGTPKDCRARLRQFLSRGISLPIIRVSVSPYKESERRDVLMTAIESLKNWR